MDFQRKPTSDNSGEASGADQEAAEPRRNWQFSGRRGAPVNLAAHPPKTLDADAQRTVSKIAQERKQHASGAPVSSRGAPPPLEPLPAPASTTTPDITTPAQPERGTDMTPNELDPATPGSETPASDAPATSTPRQKSKRPLTEAERKKRAKARAKRRKEMEKKQGKAKPTQPAADPTATTPTPVVAGTSSQTDAATAPAPEPKKPGVFGRMFGGKKKQPAPMLAPKVDSESIGTDTATSPPVVDATPVLDSPPPAPAPIVDPPAVEAPVAVDPVAAAPTVEADPAAAVFGTVDSLPTDAELMEAPAPADVPSPSQPEASAEPAPTAPVATQELPPPAVQSAEPAPSHPEVPHAAPRALPVPEAVSSEPPTPVSVARQAARWVVDALHPNESQPDVGGDAIWGAVRELTDPEPTPTRPTAKPAAAATPPAPARARSPRQAPVPTEPTSVVDEPVTAWASSARPGATSSSARSRPRPRTRPAIPADSGDLRAAEAEIRARIEKKRAQLANLFESPSQHR